MTTLSLSGDWKMKRTDSTQWLDAKVPGSVMSTLLNLKMIEDPFYRDNEDEALNIASFDYEFYKEFYVDENLISQDNIVLLCEGLDTLTEIKINGKLVANTDNMHRTYEFNMKELIKEGQNNISITFFSPLEYIERKQNEDPLWATGDAVSGISHIRKGHYMFGWDWGPKIPDLGIWRDISIKGYDYARIEDVYIEQTHEVNKVALDISIKSKIWSEDGVNIDLCVISPDNICISEVINGVGEDVHATIVIDNPKLWWPNGYGTQSLYNVVVAIKKDNNIIDKREYNIGLRTLTIKNEKDQWGESFEYVINGISIFAMGANYIPEDNILSRRTKEKTERLIKDCIAANFNCIRVWGGGIYPEDYFYDLCDSYGLIVWQDHMFACAAYRMTEQFTENIKHEAEDNIRRLRHHASICLWCGNNEMEVAWQDWDFFGKTEELKADYHKQFEVLLSQVSKNMDPNNFYWPSSPSSAGGFDKPNDENRGDVHYWDVWHGSKPFTDYRKYYFRFVSEFGFQSFPSLKTIETFTLPEDRNIFSNIMERHQKNGTANGKILFYLSETYKYPKDLDSLIYISQLLQAEAIRYGVEHWRRNRGRCMGSIYWQLNDCWPVASWSSIDSFGRWKALHYFTKRFYAPVLLSACEEGMEVALHITNESLKPIKGDILWKLRDNHSKVLKAGTVDFDVEQLSASICESLDFSQILTDKSDKYKYYLEFSLLYDNSVISTGTVLFVKPKHYQFIDPELETEVTELEDRFVISVKSKAFAKNVELDLTGADGVFSDNYFDLSSGENKLIELPKDCLSRVMTLKELKTSLKTRSLFITFN